jgi:hypothetical protein
MKLLLATACQVVINDPEFSHSLISVFHEIRFGISSSIDLPPNALIPREWSVFSKWELTDEESTGDIAQTCEMYWPDGALLSRTKLVAAKPVQRALAFNVRSQGFPVGQSGKLKIVLWIEDGEKQLSTKEELFVYVRVDRVASPPPSLSQGAAAI